MEMHKVCDVHDVHDSLSPWLLYAVHVFMHDVHEIHDPSSPLILLSVMALCSRLWIIARNVWNKKIDKKALTIRADSRSRTSHTSRTTSNRLSAHLASNSSLRPKDGSEKEFAVFYDFTFSIPKGKTKAFLSWTNIRRNTNVRCFIAHVWRAKPAHCTIHKKYFYNGRRIVLC
jgi:hypothetical protein